jgi:hypothetical protein
VSQIETGDVLEASRARVAELEAQLLEASRARVAELEQDRNTTEPDARAALAEQDDPPGREPPPLGALP